MIRPLKPWRAAVVDFALPFALSWVLIFFYYERYGRPDPRFEAVNSVSYGPIRLKLKLPGTEAGIPEPLVVCGRVGNASLIYIRLLKNARAKVGVEFWGLAAYESQEFVLPAADAQIDFNCAVPAFFPKEGDSAWQTTSAADQRLRSHRYTIEVDGIVRLEGVVDYDQPPGSPLYVGSNPLGGSLVSDLFTGKILKGPDQRELPMHEDAGKN
jgi:hypothetical protein